MTVGGPGRGQKEGRLYQATPAKLTTWLDCPRRYRFTYLDRPRPPKGPPWAHNSVGAAVHAALAQWWREDERTFDRALELVDEYWTDDGFRDDFQSKEWRVRAHDMVRRYVAELDPHDEPIGVERVVATVHQQTALSGRVDRIDERDGELVIVDYKTGRRALTVDDARSSLALAVYAAAAARTLRKPCRTVELHHLPSGEVAEWEHSDEALARHLSRADDIASECASADESFHADGPDDAVFPPRPSSYCGWCDFRSQCAEGRAASSERPPWSGLATD